MPVASFTLLNHRKLSEGTRTDALLWEGTPVAIKLPAGGWVPTKDWGHRDWLGSLIFGTMAVTVALALVETARFNRRTTTSWWLVTGKQVKPPPTWLTRSPLPRTRMWSRLTSSCRCDSGGRW